MDLSDNSGWIQLDECRGYASNIHQAEEVRKTFEVSKRSTFVSYKTVLNFGENDKIPEKYRIRFSDLGEEVVPYDGTPFIITGRKVNSCIFGKDKHVADKKKKQQDKASNLEKDHPIPVKEKVMVQTSKKKNCPASIIMKEVICFPDFKVTENTEKRKRVVSEKIRDLINGDDEIKMEYRIYMKFPTDQDHQNTYQLGELIGFMNPINKDVSAKIDELVGHGVSSVSGMRRHLKVFVNETLFSGKTLPSINDVAYYPTDTIIRKHMYMAQTKLK
ncbi:unnamed protein product [Mytilus coruscus]|uniref:Uncharacterized protein n=1 Tax=Mytilus coruscus TaxID=42192 RepID=A0A6J8CSC0_MYTCO|nr:unnamed protein product [Mytilus coruscus]